MEPKGKWRISFRRKHKDAVVLYFLIFLGFFIVGIFEHSVSLTKAKETTSLFGIPEKLSENVGFQRRRYCDPPNMTVVYEVSSEEIHSDTDFHIAEVHEDFPVNLTTEEVMVLFATQSTSWGILVSCIPASQIAVYLGGRRVFGYSLLLLAVWNSLAHIDEEFFEYRGYLNGVFFGAMIPSFYQLSVDWFAPSQRSSFVSLLSGKYLGYAFYEIVLLFILRYSFYIHLIVAIITFVWYVPWSTTISDTPVEKGKSSKEEVKPGVKISTKQNIHKFPLCNVLTSRPVWMSVAAIFSAACSEVVITKVLPLYLRHVYNVSGGYLSAVAYTLIFIFAMSCGFFVNFLLKIKFVSVTSMRRMVVYVSHFFPAALLFVLGFVGCNVMAPIIFYCLAATTFGANYSGAFSSPLDLSPKYAGTIIAICFTFGTAGSLFMTYLTSYVLEGQELGSWRLIFSITSLILLLSSIFFMLRGSGSIQVWNETAGRLSRNVNNSRNQQPRVSVVAPLPKNRTKSIYTVEQKILKVLHVQEPEKFTRVRAYSTSLPNERTPGNPPNVYRPSNKKRASIS